MTVLLAGCGASMTIANAGSVDPATPAVAIDIQRGRMLYETHCIACHTTQAHWRENSIVHSWDDVLVQVGRWQKNAGQNWGTQEIDDVAAYLNVNFYRMPCSVPGCRADDSAGIGRASRVATAAYPAPE